MQPLRKKLLWWVVSTAAISTIPALGTPAGKAAVAAVFGIVERRLEGKPQLRAPQMLRADPAAAEVYDDGVVLHGAHVRCPQNATVASCRDRGGGWWDRGPVRRGVRGVGRGVRAAFCFLTRPFRR